MIKRIGIYKITNLLNGKIYVGQSTNLHQRKIDHFKASAVNTRPKILHRDMRKFGTDNFNFEIIEECKTAMLDKREEYWIAFYQKKLKGNIYNISCKAKPAHDIEVKKSISLATTVRNKKSWADPNYRAEMSEWSSKLQKKRLKDPEYLAEKSKQLKKYTDSKKKKVYQYDKNWNLVAVFNGTREAERQTGICASSISEVARQEGKGIRKHVGGFNWRYHSVENVETIEQKTS